MATLLVSDTSVLIDLERGGLLKSGEHVLLADDGSLRERAEAEGIEYHGVLWVFDQFEESGLLTPAQLLAGPRTERPRVRTVTRLDLRTLSD